MRILILGSNGLLGQKLVHLLSKKRIDFLATSKSNNKLLSLPGMNFELLDFTNKENAANIIKRYKPITIINAGGITNVDECELNRANCHEVNVEGTRNMIEISNSLNIHYIQVSTDFVFSGKNGPYKETDTPDPVNYYGQTKLEAEQLIIQNCIKWSIIRTVLVYGITEEMSRSNIVLWVKKTLEAGKKINVVNDQFRTPTLAEDLAEGCFLVAKKNKTGIFHISGNEMMSIYEIAIKVAEYYKLDKTLISPVSSKSLNEKAMRPPVTGFIIDKAKNELDYNPHRFTEGLQIAENQLHKSSNQ